MRRTTAGELGPAISVLAIMASVFSIGMTTGKWLAGRDCDKYGSFRAFGQEWGCGRVVEIHIPADPAESEVYTNGYGKEVHPDRWFGRGDIGGPAGVGRAQPLRIDRWAAHVSGFGGAGDMRVPQGHAVSPRRLGPSAEPGP